MFKIICDLILPSLVLFVTSYGLIHKKNIYDDFVTGAKQSFDMILSIFPSMLAMIFGINILLESGFIDFIFKSLGSFFTYIKVPIDVLPMAIMRPISGSSSLAILNNILKHAGPDSLTGKMASIIQGSTDTTFYVLTLYFGSVGIKKIRYALKVGLIADLIGILSAIILSKIFF